MVNWQICKKWQMDFGCFLQSYPPAWPCVMLPGTSCKSVPPRAGGAITTGSLDILTNFVKVTNLSKVIQIVWLIMVLQATYFKVFMEIHCGQQISAFSLINPVEETLQVCQFGHLTDLSPCLGRMKIIHKQGAKIVLMQLFYFGQNFAECVAGEICIYCNPLVCLYVCLFVQILSPTFLSQLVMIWCGLLMCILDGRLCLCVSLALELKS